jgi:hypothetical protein
MWGYFAAVHVVGAFGSGARLRAHPQVSQASGWSGPWRTDLATTAIC